MSAMIATLPRVFKLGGLLLDDPSPSTPAKDAWKLLKAGFPHIKNEILSDPVIENGQEVYSIEQQPVKSNG